MRKIRGFVELKKWERGRLLWTRTAENLIVNSALPLIANLVGGAAGTNLIGVVGFGSGSAAPQVTDTDITAPAYYKAIASVTYPSAGQAQFTWSLTGAGDASAVGMTATELAFYANTGSVSLPVWRPSGTAPSLTMYAHILLNVGVIASGGSYTGTWTFVA
ncbi:MAG TPA: hypothetical protein VMU16_15440 [Candidatus Binataceae bacterium]|nr:hypothetical protein [Candidatus Binataceae bacterium]